MMNICLEVGWMVNLKLSNQTLQMKHCGVKLILLQKVCRVVLHIKLALNQLDT